MPERLVIATRASALALWQARYVRARLLAGEPRLEVELLQITTAADRTAQPLATLGGKGLFMKELEQAVVDGAADVAVHSTKDIPMELPPGLVLAAFCARAEARDAFISKRHRTLAELPPGAVIGTCSLRRMSQLRARFKHLRFKPLRGNIDTRLAKLDAGEFDAIVLAAAGLQRLNLAHRIREILPADICLPAAGRARLAWNAAAMMRAYLIGPHR